MTDLAIQQRPALPAPRHTSTSRRAAYWLRREGFGVVALVFLTVAILGPISTIILWAFALKWRYPALVPTEFGFKYWQETLARADIARAFPLSLGISIAVTALAALICFPAAYAFARMEFRGKQFFLLSFLITNAFPRLGLYVAIAVIFFRLNLVGTIPGVILIQLTRTLLLMIWIPTAAFQGVDRSLEEAALDVGASRLTVFLRITLPMVLPALFAAIILTFVGTFYEAESALLIGVPNVVTLPVLMYAMVNNSLIVQPGAILSVLLWLPSLLFLGYAQRLLRSGYLTAGFGV